MLRLIDSKKMGRGQHGWLDSFFHFSFAEYYNEQNLHFGILRVVNDDQVLPDTGFDTHPHRDMEILSYVVDGELTHADSMGHRRTLTRGQVQYMSAGTGVTHSEHNRGQNRLRFLQIWIFPDQKGYEPNYGDEAFAWEDRRDVWMPIATSFDNQESKAPIHMHADVNIAATLLSEGKQIDLKVAQGRQAYLVLIEGEAEIAGRDLQMHTRDALEITEENLTLTARKEAHMLVIEMPRMQRMEP